MVTFGSIVCNKLRQPQNYIEAVDSDSIEMKTAELLSGIDMVVMESVAAGIIKSKEVGED